MNNEIVEKKKKLNLAKIDLVTTTSEYRKRDIRKYIKRLEKEIRELYRKRVEI